MGGTRIERIIGLRILFVVTTFAISFLALSQTKIARAQSNPETKYIHVIVALCDNEFQGIVPVPPKLGNGDDPHNNLYWGALYGVRTHFKKSTEWKLVMTAGNPSPLILERVIFKHRSKNTILTADAYRGREIEKAAIDFLKAAGGGYNTTITETTGGGSVTLKLGGDADLLAYVGHDALMDFDLKHPPRAKDNKQRKTIILACDSREFFSGPLQAAGAYPLLWTTNLMAPEAYTLKSAIDGWLANESNEQIRLRAAKAYAKYQNCGLGAAKKLLVTGW